MRKSKFLKCLFISFLIAGQCVALTGCRESEEIQNIILTADAEVQDETEEINPDVEGILDEYAPEIKEDPDSGSALEKAEAALQEDANQDRLQQDTGYDPDSDINATATDGGAGNNASDTGIGDSTGTGNGTTDTSIGGNSTENGDQQPDADSTDSSGNQGNGDDGSTPSGRRPGELSDDPNARQVYDANGNQIYLPEHTTKVAATGSAALIFQMFGGNEILCASNADFLDNNLTQTVFQDEGIAKTEKLWDGDGNSPMDATAFERLLALYPDCCVGISGKNTFSEEQIQTLKDNDIPYLVLPDCSSAYNIDTAVQIAGQAIGDNSDIGGLDAAKLAEEFIAYEEKLTKEVISKHGISSCYNRNYYKSKNMYLTGSGGDSVYANTVPGTYAGYICGWDDTGYLSLSEGDTVEVEQDGLALFRHTSGAISYYMSMAGIIDVSVQNVNWTTWTGAGGVLAIGPYVDAGNGLAFVPSVNAFQKYYRSTILKQDDSDSPYNLEMDFTKTKYAYYGAAVFGYNDDENPPFLGSEDYPALLVPSQAIKEKLEASRDSELGLYRPNGSNHISSYIADYYEIYVNPSGVGSWADGSVESILESVWLSYKYYGGYTESEVKDEIKEFYSTFYRHDLSDSQLSDILNGL